MDTVVTPNPTSTVVTSESDRYRHHHDGLTGKDAAFLNSQFTLEAFRALTDTVNRNARDIEVNVERSNGEGKATTIDESRQTQNLAITGFKDVALAQATNTAALQLSAAQNTAAILAAQAECCCEIKELVRADGQMTRDLINATNMQDLRDKLAAQTNEVTLLKLKVAGINVPVI